jgi:hypothetical protein
MGPHCNALMQTLFYIFILFKKGCYPLLTNAPKYQVGEKIKVILDCESHCLAFEKNNEFLGVAFRGLFPGLFKIEDTTQHNFP